jgi:glycosyltransferase involved in cell wall biosynthesis
MKPKLSILTCAIWERLESTSVNAQRIAKLIGKLPVEHLVLFDNRARSVGLKRQALLDSARGDYIVYVDDDDDITDDFIPYVLAAIKRDPDVITYDQKAIYNGLESTVNFAHTNEDGPFVAGGITRRNLWHACTWKRELVADCVFPNVMYEEDFQWSLQARLRVKSECHIDKLLHHYTHDKDKTAAPEANANGDSQSPAKNL